MNKQDGHNVITYLSLSHEQTRWSQRHHLPIILDNILCSTLQGLGLTPYQTTNFKAGPNSKHLQTTNVN